jgi:hypothetical protein
MRYRTADELQRATAEASELVREGVMQIVAQAQTHPALKDFDDQTKITCLVDGLLTGVFGMAFAATEPESYDKVAEGIMKLLPYADRKARAIMEFDKMELQQPH